MFNMTTRWQPYNTNGLRRLPSWTWTGLKICVVSQARKQWAKEATKYIRKNACDKNTMTGSANYVFAAKVNAAKAANFSHLANSNGSCPCYPPSPYISVAPVERVRPFKYLGVRLTEYLTWSTLMHGQVTKARQQFYHYTATEEV